MATELRMDGPNAVVAKRRPDDPDAHARLVAEHRLLSDLDLPGIVRPTTDDVTDEPALLLEVAGTSTLATARPSPDEVRTIGAELADTISALHERGVAHGAIAADHVLWSPGRAPVLCGFGSASTDGSPSHDIEALGELLLALAPDDPAIRDAVSRAGGDLSRLGAALRPVAPTGPTLPPTASPPSRRPAPAVDPRHLPRAALLAAAAVAVVLAAIGVLVLTSGGDPEVAAAPPPTTAVAPATATTATPVVSTPTSEPVERVWPTEPECPAPAEVTGEVLGTTDLDLDGCPELVGRDGAALSVGGRRFELGVDGDLIVLGDWTCDGQATPALISAADGAIHPFPTWPDEAPLDVEAVAVVGEVTSATVVDEGCDVLVVELADGTTTEITW